MAAMDIASKYFTYESRFVSFQKPQPRTSSATSKSTKSLKWPHRWLSAELLALAGFFFNPTAANPDNVNCFLCHRALDGWEEGDDPLAEHLKHSPECGWAIVASIEKQHEELSQENPASERMVEARKATFSNLWPHEGKKGWKCKIKQMAEAGWKYTPTPEYDDMATCAYCALGLDGWEPSDKPIDEHFSRSPDCAFFTLINSHRQDTSTKKTKSKKGRASKASRFSTQSTITVASEAPSLTDLPAEEEDSILTTATQSKKMPQGKKATTARMTRASRMSVQSITTSAIDLPAEGEDSIITAATNATATQGKKAPRGKKATTTKKTRASRLSTQSATPAIVDILAEDEDSIITTATNATATQGKKMPKGKKAGTTRKTRASQLSTRSTTPSVMDIQAEDEDSVITTATNPTATQETEMPQRKKATTGRKTRTRNDEPMEVVAAGPAPRTRGKKRKSDEVLEDVDGNADVARVEIPPSKRISTGRRRSRPDPERSSQSSDAENHPPKLIQFESPSKRNVIAGGLQSSHPWTPVDLDTVMMNSPSNGIANSNDIFGMALDRAKGGLTDLERKMTVEEWIRHNAAMAAEKLRQECERMVNAFEREGARAMAAIEGIECTS